MRSQYTIFTNANLKTLGAEENIQYNVPNPNLRCSPSYVPKFLGKVNSKNFHGTHLNIPIFRKSKDFEKPNEAPAANILEPYE